MVCFVSCRVVAGAEMGCSWFCRLGSLGSMAGLRLLDSFRPLEFWIGWVGFAKGWRRTGGF